MKIMRDKSWSRARNLSDLDIKEIVDILDGWEGKLSWDLLVESINKRLNQRYTRQALNNHSRIADAFKLRKRSLSAQPIRQRLPIAAAKIVDQEIDVILQHNHYLEAKVQRLEAENNRIQQRHVRWAYNAALRGLNMHFLDRPLPVIDRQQTEVTMESLSKKTR